MSSAQSNPASLRTADPFGGVLDVYRPDGGQLHVPLPTSRMIIGRSAEAHLRLESEKVSRRHAELFRDPFGRWWIHDLGSRNGTKVNGADVRERTIGLGDAVEIGGFTLRLHQPKCLGTRGSGTDLQAMLASDEEGGLVTTLAELPSPRVTASHLAMLMGFGQRLIGMENAQERLRTLCQLMVGNDFHGLWAAAMRLPADKPDAAPQLLCEPARRPDWQGVTPHISRTLLRAVCQRHQPVIASNLPLASVDMNLSLPADVMAMSAMACPLGRETHEANVLYVILPPEFGTGEWLALGALAAEQFQQSEFAWAARQQAQAYAAIEWELAQAREIQMRLIPQSPAVAGMEVAIGFEPCRWVAGDYVDVVPTADGRTLLTVADACGKGLQAALVAASVHSMVHTGVRAGLGLRELMAALNDHLCQYTPERSFVTMVSVLADPRTGDLETANAGHPPAAILDPKGDLRWLRSGSNMPLGIAPGDIQCDHERMDIADLLFLYTDGLTDTHGPGRKGLGQSGLGDFLRSTWAQKGRCHVREMADSLTRAIGETAASGLLEDDRAFLLAQRV